MAQPPVGGIKLVNLSAEVRARMALDVNQATRIVTFPGQLAQGLLSLAANVVAGETVLIGPVTAAEPAIIGGIAQSTVVPLNTFVAEVVATALAALTASNEWNNTNNPIKVTISPAPGLVAGDMLNVQSELFKIISVLSSTSFLLARGRGGTTIATHADGLAINKAASPTASISWPTAGTLTPAVMGPSLAFELNNPIPGTTQQRCVAKASSLWTYLNAVSLASGAQVLVYGLTAQNIVGALAETLAGANNQWSAANLAQGAAGAPRATFQGTRVPTATEVVVGQMHFLVPFQPSILNVSVVVTASGLATAWDGAVTVTQIAGSLYRVTLDNAGAVDWATTSTVYVTASN